VANRIRLAVIDDHPLLRDGVVGTLSRETDIDVVAVGASADDAIRIARDLSPDILLLDISMPGDGIVAARAILATHPGMKAIMLTVSEREEDLNRAMQAGVHGYVLKGINGYDLVNTIRSVARGETYITPQFAARLLSTINRRPSDNTPPKAPALSLTAREEQILREVAAGLTNKEIARKLSLSEKTIKHYMTNVLQKLQVRNRVEAVIALQKSDRGNS
jgi:DNA-binding NarL/FixJ family response regulator